MPRRGPSLPRPTVGAPAPPVDLTDTEGRRWRLSDHRGTAVVMLFHRHLH